MRKLLSILVLLGLAVAADCGVAAPLSSPASEKACTVYRSLFDFLQNKRSSNVRADTVPLEDWSFAGEDSGESRSPPTRFTPPGKGGMAEEFEVETSGFITPLMAKDSISIAHCFEGEDGPATYETFDRGNTVGAVYEVSPIGFSPDSHFALLYETDVCDMLCGSGSLILFERRGNAWVVVGTSLVWIS